MMFSTPDHDNDHSGGNCSAVLRWTWWLDYCTHAYPKEQYTDSEITGYDKYITWYH